ncbi:MAG TPA: flagellar basal body-associated FliL family protein [Candidatus Angelobacter sp.]|nr:flagellar basal body-associated FliL family protein [Candidatus Angelobacter sp.]
MLLTPAIATKPQVASRSNLLSLLLVFTLLASALGAVGCKQMGAEAQENNPAAPAMIHLDPFVVNLADGNGQSFLRVGIDLGIEFGPKGKRHESVAVMRDSIISVLSTCKSDDLLTPDGKKKIKQELSQALNERLPDMKVREIYFTEFMVQR